MVTLAPFAGPDSVGAAGGAAVSGPPTIRPQKRSTPRSVGHRRRRRRPEAARPPRWMESGLPLLWPIISCVPLSWSGAGLFRLDRRVRRSKILTRERRQSYAPHTGHWSYDLRARVRPCGCRFECCGTRASHRSASEARRVVSDADLPVPHRRLGGGRPAVGEPATPDGRRWACARLWRVIWGNPGIDVETRSGGEGAPGRPTARRRRRTIPLRPASRLGSPAGRAIPFRPQGRASAEIHCAHVAR